MKKRKQASPVLFFSILGLCLVLLFFLAVLPDPVTSVAEKSSVEERLEIAREKQLLDWVDEEGYLQETFFEGKRDCDLQEQGIDPLIRSWSQKEVDRYVEMLRAGISLYTVTRYEKVGQKNPSTGNMLYTGIFEVDGVLAFCIERSMGTPAKGSPTGTPTSVSNEKLRKVLYYGYHGPKDKGYTYVETALAAGEANGDGDNSLGRKILAEIVQYAAPPSNFKVWKVTTNGGKTQDLAYYTIVEEYGSVKLKKSSSNTDMTSGNSCYSLVGATYTLYNKSSCTSSSKVGNLTVGSNGSTSNTLKVKVGTYYLKESEAPTGYALSTSVKTVKVTANTTVNVSVSDVPQSNKMDLLLKKVDRETQTNVSQGDGTLEGAEFTVKYFDGYWSEGVDPETKGETPTRTWIFQTDAEGVCKYSETYRIGGSALYLNSKQQPALPLGTVTIQETKAPEGYLLNSDLWIRQITSKGSGESVSTYQIPVIQEQITSLILQKYQKDTKQGIPDVVFLHQKPDGTEEEILTDANGILELKGLTSGEHQLKEKETPKGYRLYEKPILFVVDEEHNLSLKSETIEGILQIVEGGNGKLSLCLYNEVVPFELVLAKANQKSKPLKGAEFSIFLEESCETLLQKQVTDQQGTLVFENLKVGMNYYIKETKAPKGYRKSDEIHKVYVSANPMKEEFVCFVDDQKEGFFSNGSYQVTEDSETKTIHMTWINEVGYLLPNTGSCGQLLQVTMGSILGIGSMIVKRKEIEYEE